MAGVLDEFLQEDGAVAKGLFGLATRIHHFGTKLLLVSNDPHAPTAAARRGLDDDGVADTLGLPGGGFGVADVPVAILDQRHPDPAGQFLGGHLVAQLVHALRARTDELDAGIPAGSGKVHVLRQKAVAGVNGVNLFFQRQLDDGLDVDVGAQRLIVRADLVALVGLVAVQAVAILVGVNGYRPHL